MQSLPLELVGVEGAQRDPGLHDGDRQRVGGQAVALEGAVVEAVQRQLLDRRGVAVGVEPDLAEEDPVGPGDRPLAQVDRVGAVEAVGEVAEAAADRLGALAGRPSTSIQAMPRPGNSAARCGATQPCSGEGFHSTREPAASAPDISTGPPGAGGAQQAANPGVELGGGEVADARRSAGCRRGRRRRRSGSRRPGRGSRPPRRGRSRPASSSRAPEPGRERRRDRRARPARGSSPVHGSARRRC